MEAAIEGITQSLISGHISGYEVIDVDIEIKEIDYLEDQSTLIAFKTCAAYALTEALKDGESKLLEPFFHSQCSCPPRKLYR